jgi:hypothetical protein
VLAVGFVTILLPGLVLGFALPLLAWGVMRILPERFHPTGDDPVGTMVGGIILVFAFVLGLTVSEETSTLAAAKAAAATEANSVGELYWYAHALSEPEHSRLQVLLRTYATVVVAQEWPLLGQHKSSEQASAAVRAIREDILVFQPATPIEKAVYSNELTQVSNLFTARRARLDAATAGGVPLILIQGLMVLVGLILLAIPYSGLLKGLRRLLLYGVFGAFLIAALFLILDLNNPFAGTVAVHPTSFNILFNGTFVHVS